MQQNRAGERGTTPSRNDRFFADANSWYFSTREGCPIGPYTNKNQAGKGLNNFLEFLSLAKPKMLTSFYTSLFEDSSYS